jgi:hypothetical protein
LCWTTAAAPESQTQKKRPSALFLIPGCAIQSPLHNYLSSDFSLNRLVCCNAKTNPGIRITQAKYRIKPSLIRLKRQRYRSAMVAGKPGRQFTGAAITEKDFYETRLFAEELDSGTDRALITKGQIKDKASFYGHVPEMEAYDDDSIF